MYVVRGVDCPLPFPLLNVTGAHIQIDLLDCRIYLAQITSDLMCLCIGDGNKRTSIFSGDIGTG